MPRKKESPNPYFSDKDYAELLAASLIKFNQLQEEKKTRKENKELIDFIITEDKDE